MITESAIPVASPIPSAVSETIGKLHADVEKLQQELAQALEVWQSTLAVEKAQFGALLKHKELAWSEQESQWARQSQAYEQRLAELESDFETRLKQTELNAARALGQLDDDWLSDKLEWGSPEQWLAERRVLEEKVASLENRLAERKVGVGSTPATVKALQSQLLEFQQTVASFEDRAARSDELVNACMRALDYQISILYDLLHHYASETPGGGSPSDLVQP